MATKTNISASVGLASLLLFQCAMAIAADSAETLENILTKVSYKLTPSYYQATFTDSNLTRFSLGIRL